jgi:hypothetical protein
VIFAVAPAESKKPLSPEDESGRGILPQRESVYEQSDQDDDRDRYAEEEQQ